MKSVVFFVFLLHFANGRNLGNYLACNNNSTCGQAKGPHTPPQQPTTYIVGGQNSIPHSWPWMVAIYFNGVHRCGGTLIRSCSGAIVVLTTARCVENLQLSKVIVKIGINSLSSHEPVQSDHNVQEIILHENFTASLIQNDIAILKLTTPAAENNAVAPICVTPLPSSYYYSKLCVVTGWGLTNSASQQLSDVLREVYKPVKNDSECQLLLGGGFEPSMMMCAGVDGDGICSGDIGGPLACKNNVTGLYDLIGIVSWGFTCASDGLPAVYVDVHKYLDWITHTA